MADWDVNAWRQVLAHAEEIYSDEEDWVDPYKMTDFHFRPPINNQPGNGQNQAPSRSNASLLKRNSSNLSEADRAKKRKIDQAYRERCKKAQEDMQSNLKMLVGENNSLKKENDSLKEENAEMNQTLRGQEKVIDQLRNSLAHLKHEYGKQNVLVQTLSGFLADPVRLENEKLKDENASLRKNVYLNDNSSLLMEENAKLRTDNKVLKVQNDALCGKIISDNDKKREQEQEDKIPLEDMPPIIM